MVCRHFNLYFKIVLLLVSLFDPDIFTFLLFDKTYILFMFLPLISQILYELVTFVAAQIKNNQVIDRRELFRIL